MMRLLLITILLASPIWSANAAQYYVEKDGSDAAAGTSWAASWLTISKVNSTVVAGDTVRFGTGRWLGTSLIPPTGGDASNITYYVDSTWSAATRGLAIISGGEAVTGWTNVSGNLYKASWTPAAGYYNASDGEKSYTLSQNDTLLNPQTTLGAVDAAGEFYHTATGDTIYANLWGNVDPSTVTMNASSRPALWFQSVNQDYLHFYGLDFRMGKGGTVFFQDVTNLSADHITFDQCNITRSSFLTGENSSVIFIRGNFTSPSYDSANIGDYVRYVTFNACSIGVATAEPNANPVHKGNGMTIYDGTNIFFDSCFFYDLPGDGIEVKNSYSDVGLITCQITARSCRFDGMGGGGVNIYTNGEHDSVYGCIFIGNEDAGIQVGQSSIGNTDGGNHFFANNTFYQCNEALQVQYNDDVPHDYAPYTGEFKYNISYDKVASALGNNYEYDFRDNVTGLDIWIDSNQHYDPSVAFSANWSGTPTTWTNWQGTADNDSNGLNTDPGLNTTTFATTSAGTMSRTYGGQNWTKFGAIQGAAAITDSCIQITGKTTLALSDTCYCIVDSLLYTFAQRDTLINTGGYDNIRIWGSHAGGGRGIIAYSASDTGSLSWPTDSAKSAVVIHAVNSDSVTIGNLAIVPRTIDDSVRQIVCVNGLTVRGLHLDNDSIVTAGFSSRAFQESTTGGSSSMNMLLEDSYFGTTSKGYNRRDQLYGATILAVAGLKTDGMYEYLLHVRNCNIFTVHTGIGISGDDLYPVFYIDSNTITVDSRNDLYMTYDDNDVNNSNGDPYGIGVDGSDSLSRITGNTINSVGGTYYGGDGMLLQHISASATNRFEVYNNTITLEHGVHPRIAAGRQAAVGFYVRNYDASLFVKGLHLHDNTVNITLDTNEATTYRGYLGEGIRLGFENGSTGNLIENNRVNIVAADSATRTTINTMEGAALSINQRDTTYVGDELTLNNIVRYNWLRSPKNPIWLGDTRVGYGANNITFEGDTVIATYVGDSTFVRFHQSSTYFDHHRNNKLKDMTLLGNSSADDVIKGTIPTTPDSLGKQLSYVQDITVNFKDASSANISGGTVWALDNYGNRFDFPNTDGSGNSLDELRFRFFGYDAVVDGFAVEDSSLYNPFTFWAKSGTDSTSDTMSVGWSTSAINLQLPNVSIMNIIRGICLQGVTIK